MSVDKKHTNLLLLFAWVINLLAFANLVVYFIKPVLAYIVDTAYEYVSLFDNAVIKPDCVDIVSAQIQKLHIFAVIWARIYWSAVYNIRIRPMIWKEIENENSTHIIKNIVWGYVIPLMLSYIIIMGSSIILFFSYWGYWWRMIALFMVLFLILVSVGVLFEINHVRRIIRKMKAYIEEQ